MPSGYTATTNRVWVPNQDHFAHFTPIAQMRAGRPTARFMLRGAYPAVTLPIDWTKNDALAFPTDGNDRYGDCFYAAACHADNTFTGNVGTESVFDTNVIIENYLRLSGGDNGLSEGQIVSEWRKGLAGIREAVILDALDLDPTSQSAMQAALYFFGVVMFTLAVPDVWINNFRTNAVWTNPATSDPNNGHAILWNGADTAGRYKFQSWGTHGWITPGGVLICDPAAFVVFSLRWFNAYGIAPNGKTYDQLAALWVQFGGKRLPPNPFPTPTPTPTPTPEPEPTPVPITTVQIDPATKTVTSPAAMGMKFVKANLGKQIVTVDFKLKQIIMPATWKGTTA